MDDDVIGRADAPGQVEDGRIVLAAGDPMTGITTTRKDLPKTDYELTYEAMRTSGGDFFAAATLTGLDGAGHFSPLEAPAAFAAAITAATGTAAAPPEAEVPPG